MAKLKVFVYTGEGLGGINASASVVVHVEDVEAAKRRLREGLPSLGHGVVESPRIVKDDVFAVEVTSTLVDPWEFRDKLAAIAQARGDDQSPTSAAE